MTGCQSLTRFSVVESFLIDTLRAAGNDLAALDRSEEDLLTHLGPGRGGRTFYTVCRMGKLLRRFGRQSWTVKPVGCPDIAAAECGFLNMIAAHQAGNAEHAMAISRWFCTAEVQKDITDEAAVVGRSLCLASHRIPLRTSLGSQAARGHFSREN